MGDTFVALTIMAWLAYVASRLLRRSLPEFIAFLLVGVLLGPEGAGLIDAGDLGRLSAITGVALAILMFIIGERVSFRSVRARTWVPAVGAIQYLVAAGAVFGAAAWAGADRDTALLLGALGGAGAPLTVSAVAASVRARGQYVGRAASRIRGRGGLDRAGERDRVRARGPDARRAEPQEGRP